jgi:hypothetical protein
MIRLTFHGKDGALARVLELSDFRVMGGALWNPLEQGLLATYAHDGWQHRGEHYRQVSVEGRGCLLFGITRDPTLLSDPVGLLLFSGRVLRAHGIAIAEYIEQQEMWHGVLRPMWWSAMRVVSAEAVSALVDTSRVVRLNPWEPLPARVPDSLPVPQPREYPEPTSQLNEPSRVVSGSNPRILR